MLPCESLSEYERHGFFYIKGLFSKEELQPILDEDEKQCDHLQLNSPVLSINQFKTMRQYMKDTVKVLDTTLDITDPNNNFEKKLIHLNRQAEEAVREGYVHIILTDKNLSRDNVALPMILATSSVHSHLIKKNLRTDAVKFKLDQDVIKFVDYINFKDHLARHKIFDLFLDSLGNKVLLSNPH